MNKHTLSVRFQNFLKAKDTGLQKIKFSEVLIELAEEGALEPMHTWKAFIDMLADLYEGHLPPDEELPIVWRHKYRLMPTILIENAEFPSARNAIRYSWAEIALRMALEATVHEIIPIFSEWCEP